ncbi:MAG TPA: phosphatase PAP2 family protein [Flavisolibacter sp.]|jgi:undecaprenyl-diphosphatase|nr:phosphatase PAP2 family protein [Flavisolibacter sp.]
MYKLLQADKDLFRILNGKWHNSFFDWLMPYLRQAEVWLPLYLFVLVFVLMNVKKSGWFILICICTVALTDILSSDIIKELIFRTRPCHDPDVAETIRFLVSYCPQSSSFTSSHATNHFGLAVFWVIALKPYVGRWIYIGYFWAFIISYAQIYVGVHFPIDVFCGALVGIITGTIMGKLYTKKAGSLVLVNN